MAVEIALTSVEAKSEQGAVIPAVRGWPARFLRVATPGASALVQDGAAPWTAIGAGLAIVDADETVWVRFCDAGDVTAAGPGAAHKVRAGQSRAFSYRPGQQLRVAVAA